MFAGRIRPFRRPHVDRGPCVWVYWLKVTHFLIFQHFFFCFETVYGQMKNLEIKYMPGATYVAKGSPINNITFWGVKYISNE